MRFLKNKIALAHKARESSLKVTISSLDDPIESSIFIHTCSEHTESTLVSPQKSISSSPTRLNHMHQKRPRTPGHLKTPKAALSIKNIVKNFGKAICSFICSDLALPYVKSLAHTQKFNAELFTQYVFNIKETIDSVQGFRNSLLITDLDNQDIATYKVAFGELGRVFIRRYSISWIFNGRLRHKEEHLRFRSKLLRKMEKPENLIYLKY